MRCALGNTGECRKFNHKERKERKGISGMNGEWLPTKVKVGPFEYEIRWLDLKRQNRDEIYGKCNSDKCVIWLPDGRKRQRVGETFFHEVTHAIWYVYGLGKKESQEKAVKALALGWSAFMRDNSEALIWMHNLMGYMPDCLFERNETGKVMAK